MLDIGNINIGLDIATAIAIVGSLVTYILTEKTGRRETIEDKRIEDNKIVIMSIMETNAPAQQLVNAVLKDSTDVIIKEHKVIWKYLSDLKLNMAIHSNEALYLKIDFYLEQYKESVENNNDSLLAFYYLAMLFYELLSSVQQSTIVVEDYIKDRFGYSSSEFKNKIKRRAEERSLN